MTPTKPRRRCEWLTLSNLPQQPENGCGRAAQWRYRLITGDAHWLCGHHKTVMRRRGMRPARVERADGLVVAT